MKHTYKVTFDNYNYGIKTVLVTAENESDAIQIALKFFFNEEEINDGFANIYVRIGKIIAKEIQKPEKKTPYYVTTYGKYPIYEPAEGGYYYNGIYVISSYEFQTLRKAKKFLRKRYKEWKEIIANPEEKKYCSSDHKFFGINGKYIGDGWFVQLEKKQGKSVSGWQPYC